MSIPGSASPLFFQAAAADAAPAGVAKSLRFNDDDGGYLSRTPSSASNRKTWTWSAWVKRSTLGIHQYLLSAGSASNYFALSFDNNDKWQVDSYGGGANAFYMHTGDTRFRDVSAWYHLVCVLDTTESTGTDRFKLYVNGSQVTLTTGTNVPPSNADQLLNNNIEHRIGRIIFGNSTNYFDGYLANIHFVDGSALDPTSFGAFDSNGVWQAADYSGTYGTNGYKLTFSSTASNAALGTDSSGNSNTWTVNNIQATNTGNSAGFKAVTWSGNGSTQNITSLSFQPDLVWYKQRNSSSYGFDLFDSVRGVNKIINSNNNFAEYTESNRLTAFNSNGFTLGNSAPTNGSGGTYVGWCFKAGGAASSNSDGTITSSVSASTEYGFSVVTFTGPGSAGFASVGHGLGQKPKVIFCKDRSNARNWSVFHEDVITSDTDILSLNQDVATFTSGTAAWDVSAIDSSTFTPYFRDDFGPSYGADNVAYLWCEKSGFSKFGTYTGNGNTSGGGPRVDLGFKPAFLLVKGFNVQSGWRVYDSTRDSGGQFQKRLYANETSAESTNSTQYVNYDDTGFDVEASGSLSTYNVSGKTYIYMAFAQDPGVEVIDTFLDVPTNGDQSDTGAGGEVAGNYATLNPLQNGLTLKNGNLTFSMGTRVDWKVAHGTIHISSGKWYWEMTCGTQNSSGPNIAVGIRPISYTNGNTQEIGYNDGSKAYFANGGTRNGNTSATASYGASFGTGDVIGVAFDADNGTLVFYKNGASQGTAFTGLTGSWVPAFGLYTGQTQVGTDDFHVNFGQRAFTHSAPSNYKALCTTNLPTPTVADGSDYFDQLTYVGNQTARSITGLNFSPDLVVVKNRERSSYNHYWVDTVRGGGKNLYSNLNEAEHVADRITTLDSAGFTLSNHMGPNYSGENYIAHCWDAGSSTATNTDGSITTSLRVNATAGFAIAGYTGNDTTGATIGHGLSAVPAFWLLKDRDNNDMWIARHTGFANTHYLEFNATYGIRNPVSDVTGDSDPTNTVIPVGEADTNNNGRAYIAYIWAPVAGFSAAPSWTGNGNSDGVFIHLGFRAKAFWFKRTDSASNFYVYDTTRSTANPVNKNLEWNTGDAENTLTSMNVDFLSNGIKVRGSDGDINASGGSYIGFAWAENPFQANGGLAR